MLLFVLLFTLLSPAEFKYKPGDELKSIAVIKADSVSVDYSKTTTEYFIQQGRGLLIVKIDSFGYFIQICRDCNPSKSYPIYYVEKSELENNVIQKHLTWFNEKNGKKSSTSFTLTQMTIPFKFYTGKDAFFTGSLNLGTSFGYQVRMSNYRPNYFSLVSFVGLSSVRMDKGIASLVGDTAIDVAALTGAFGIAVNLNKAQISALIGWDYVNQNNLRYGWIYNARPWISVGMGYTLFTSPQND